ncbi:MAG: sensor histidine kinase [Bacteroidales bacterium]|nr:sensor histidine kinase [Bacteroidales bacterium]
MSDNKIKILKWKNCIVLLLVAYVLSNLMWWMVDDTPLLSGSNSGKEIFLYFITDLLFCIFFMVISLLYSHFLFRFLPHNPYSYIKLIIYSSALFLINNIFAYGMTGLRSFFDDSPGVESLFMKDAYINGMIAAFISGIYSCTVYLESYMRANSEKTRLENELMKEKEIALQSQLQSLKAQIDPHFMFNNFSILAELIQDDPRDAERFLHHLSRVYRYITQNLERSLITVSEETVFLEHYLYLVRMRYGEGVIVNIDKTMKQMCDKHIPPACMQLLVENAIKHNGHSPEYPLTIDILCTEGFIIVRNNLSPLLSKIESTGLGQKNIIERYALLSPVKVQITKTDTSYCVCIPVINENKI